MTIKGLLFDFDGLILETEEPDFRSWQDIYHHYGATLDLTTWLPLIGTGNTTQTFDAYVYLEQLIGRELDREEVRTLRRNRYAEFVTQLKPLPGVVELMLEAKQAGLKLAVASSSTQDWVIGHLTRLQLIQYLDCVVCGDMVPLTKPYPDVYLAALAKLNIQGSEGIALEDSLNGLRAAKQAGLYCVAVPNVMTQHLSFTEADACLHTLGGISLNDLKQAIQEV